MLKIGSESSNFQPRTFSFAYPVMKRQREDALLELRRIGTSTSSIIKCVQALREKPELLTHAASSTTMNRHLHEQYALHSHCIDLPLKTGGVFKWHVVLPQTSVICFSERAGTFRDVMIKTAARVGAAHKWPIILYNDEVTPGNVLRADNRRKFVAFYWSLLDFGQALRREECWLHMGVLRQSLLNTISGGLSSVTRMLLRACLLEDTESLTSGVTLNIPAPYLFFGSIGVILGDESSLKQTWDLKGASGLRPCIKCKNCTMKNSGLQELDASGFLLTICCEDILAFDPQSNADIWWVCDHLMERQRVVSKKQLDKLETAVGVLWNPLGILADQDLREFVKPLDICFDAMHCYYSSGVASLEMHLFLEAASAQLGLTFKDIRLYFAADWRLQDNVKTSAIGEMTFSDNREKSSKESFKGMASELLCVYPTIE